MMVDPFMNWEKFMGDHTTIGSIYKNTSFENVPDIEQNVRKIAVDWCENPSKSIIFYGDTGNGKTSIIVCMLRKLFEKIHHGNFLWYISTDLDEKMLSEIKLHGFSNTLENAKSIPFLFIDDLGCESTTARVLLQYEKITDVRVSNERATIISTNWDAKKIREKFGSRTLSRLKTFEWVKCTGRDLRGTR